MKIWIRGKNLRRSLPLSAIGVLLLSFLSAVPTQANLGEELVNNRRILQNAALPPLGEAERFLPPNPYPQGIYLILRLSDRRVYVYHSGKLQASYPVAIGKQGWETPVGKFRVRQMVVDPAWQHPWTGEVIPPGDNNPLGRRWIGFWTDGKDDIGFHGTPREELVGQAVSHGCVRMRNEDVLALFKQVRIGTPVVVEP